MNLFTESELRERYRRRFGNRQFSAGTEALNECVHILDSSKTYDIFLSHSSKDYEIVAGLVLRLQDFGLKVYADWNDKNLNPQGVSSQTAQVLKQRMARCKCLIYAFSENATHSKWMPWELGYFDGLKNGKVAVLPITRDVKSSIVGSEFVGLYPQIKISSSLTGNQSLRILDGLYSNSAISWINN